MLMNALLIMARVPMPVSTQKAVIIVSVLLDILYMLITIIVKVGYAIYVYMHVYVYTFICT